MQSQRFVISVFFLLFLTAFYLTFWSLLKNERNSLNTFRLKALAKSEPRLFSNGFLLQHDNTPLSKRVSERLSEFMALNGASASVSLLESTDSDESTDDVTHSDLDGSSSTLTHVLDLTNLEKPFKVTLNYAESVPRGRAQERKAQALSQGLNFDLRITGLSSLVFTLYGNTEYSEELCEELFSLTKKLLMSEGKGLRDLKGVLDVNFVLMSDDRRVSWDFANQVLEPYLKPLLSVLSLFHDLNLHSRVVSNANFRAKVTSQENGSANEFVIDLAKEEHGFYNLFEGLANVDISMEDNHFFRHSLNFFAILTQKPTYVRDPFTGKLRETFTLDNLGVFTFLNNRFPPQAHSEDRNKGTEGRNTYRDQADVPATDVNHLESEAPGSKSSPRVGDIYHLDDQDVSELVSRWATHTRHLHGLPSSTGELTLSLLRPSQSLEVLGSNSFLVSPQSEAPDRAHHGADSLRFTVTWDEPAGGCFYGFEVVQLCRSFYQSYFRTTLSNLRKCVELSKVSFNTQVPKSTLKHFDNSLDALEYVVGRAQLRVPELSALDANARALLMAKLAFRESLEALSDDQMFNRHVLSYEHMLAVFMSDVFPLVLPVASYFGKLLVNRVKQR